jgi:hypothetical protein
VKPSQNRTGLKSGGDEGARRNENDAIPPGGVNNLTVSDLLTRQREAANRQVSVPAVLLSRVLRNYECELENRIGMAWEAGRQEPESVRNELNNVRALQEALAA